MSSKHFYTDFKNLGPSSQDDGTATSGTNGESNFFWCDGAIWEDFVIGTRTALRPIIATEGIDVKFDDANAEGSALTPLGHHVNAPLVYTIGTDPAFFCELQVQVTDWSGVQLMVGFHGGAAGTIQAHQATWANYTDKATIGNYAGGAVNCYTSTALNNAADVDTDTTINFTDGDVAKLKVMVSAAGAVTYALSIAATATPTTFTAQTLTTVAYTFDDTDNVIPFIYVLTHTETASLIELNSFECGYQTL